MWKMFDDNIECDECGGPLEPPPKFMIPPPPRPPSMADHIGTNCNEEEMLLKAQRSWDSDMCEAIPIYDATLYSSHSLQTSAMIAVFSLLLVLVVLISSLFVWKNKRKVQNFLPCKTPTRGPHINGSLPIGSGHSVTYEDPDAHLGHRPLVMRHHHHHHHHHNVEMLHSKGIHYPSGYPMTRSPPFLVSSSPGPDPYRSNDNVYEELGPGRDSDGESEPPIHSDDDFAEDELSLPGERSFNKSTTTSETVPVSTIYHERATTTTANVTAGGCTATGQERSSLLSSSSSTSHTHDASTATASLSASSSNNNNNFNSASASARSSASSGGGGGGGGGGILSGVLRHTTGRSKFGCGLSTSAATARKNPQKTTSMSEFNTNALSAAEIATSDMVVPISPLYDNRSNLMALTCASSNHPHSHHPSHSAHHQQQHKQQSANHHSHSLHHLNSNHNMNNINNNNNSSNNNNNSSSLRPHAAPIQFYNTLESEVERRNRINNQLHQAPAATATPVSTIFRERINYPGTGRYPQQPSPYCGTTATNGPTSGNLLLSSMRSRTNPRCIERRRITASVDPIEPTYGYAEPIFHEAYLYDTCSAAGTPPPQPQQQQQQPRIASQMSYPAYIMPDYTTGGLYHRSHSNHHPYQNPSSAGSQIYSRDSSFGSDSGYSHHTPSSSSIGRHDYDVAGPPISSSAIAKPATATTKTTRTQKPASKLASALSFGWNRRATKFGNGNSPGGGVATSSASNANRALSVLDRSPNNNVSQRTTTTTTMDGGSSSLDSNASTTTLANTSSTIPNGGCNNNLSTSTATQA